MALVKRFDFSNITHPAHSEDAATSSEFSLFSQKLGAKMSNESFIAELVRDEMKMQIHTPCGAFHKSDDAFIWSIRALPRGTYIITKVMVTREMATTWMRRKIYLQLQAGAPPNIQWRTELCTVKYMGKVCSAAECEFAHSLDELQEVLRHKNYKRNLCQNYHFNYRCRYSNRCRYRHVMDPDLFVDKEFTPSEFLNAIKVDSWGAANRVPMGQALKQEEEGTTVE